MKLRSRDINIFSMSALDLFASAMGAFMLLSVMALPFFPNTGDSPELVADVQEELEQTQAELEETQSQLEDAEAENDELSEELVQVRIPDIDIVICLDVSGSMGEQVAQLKQQIVDLADVLDRLAPSVGIGVVAYGDRNWDRPLSQQDILPTSNLAQITAFIDTLETNMGLGGGFNDDTPEALDSALTQAVNMSWRGQSQRRYVIAVTDAPAYSAQINAALETARQFSSTTAPEQYVSTVMVRTSEAADFLEQLSQAGQGQFIDSTSGQSMLASILMAVINI